MTTPEMPADALIADLGRLYNDLTPGAIDRADLDGHAFTVRRAIEALSERRKMVEALEKKQRSIEVRDEKIGAMRAAYTSLLADHEARAALTGSREHEADNA